MFFKKCNYFVIILLLIVLSGCCQYKIVNPFEYGKLENNIYENTYFKIKVKIPDTWVIQSKEKIENLSRQGSELAAGSNKNLKEKIKAAENNSSSLLAVFKYEIGASVDFNPSIILISENISYFPGIRSGADYLLQAKKLLRQSQIKMEFEQEEDFPMRKIGNRDFYYINVKADNQGNQIKQVYYSRVVGKFCLNLIVSYLTEAQKAEIEQTLNEIEFYE